MNDKLKQLVADTVLGSRSGGTRSRIEENIRATFGPNYSVDDMGFDRSVSGLDRVYAVRTPNAGTRYFRVTVSEMN